MSEGAAEADAVQPTAGMLLRRAREASGLHVAALAVALKVPVRKLELLEQDRTDLLPGAVFVRALAASVCRHLKIDPQPVLDLLPQGDKPRLVQAREGINAPFRAPGDRAGPSRLDLLARPAVMLAAAILLGAAVLLAWPWLEQIELPRDAASAALRAASQAVAVTEPAPDPAAAPARPGHAGFGTGATTGAGERVTVAVTPTPTADASAQKLRTTPTASVPSVLSPTAVVTPGPGPTAAAPGGTLATAPAPGGLVVFKAAAPSWVQVTDGRGATPLRKLLAPGESVGATGALPLSVTVGSADTTQVQVRGRPFDLGPVTRDNVARFEVR